ncbi:glucooligosaccharide oxidase [Sphaerulina musiva SO2202]|uniref:Glucooligosaccharide oxidase n=1 Tax=Sphaerulina musiva (strain SO2202) TaxID=692275 RepID=N1QFQ9_SPHMS|nr:glucooligosaccharide oxidase [Sphaerulina musiva SO2202]EMF09348.1 glucooligosaccharide oxidase [Sphaerulina musiva SO2202]
MLVASLLAVIAFGYTNAKVITRQQEPFEACVVNAVDGKTEQYALPSGVNYTTSLNVYNLDHIYIPSAVAYPTSAEQVAALVKCACSAGVAVQALSGGHSFLNFGLGGQNGSLSIRLGFINDIFYDVSAETMSFGTGNLLSTLTKELEANERTAAYSSIGSIGTGGHFAIGGLGPLSRLHGLAADQIVEAEVVLADGSIVTASESVNEDIFFAIRGAAWSFGIVTSITIRTQPIVPSIPYSYVVPGNSSTLAAVLSAWQSLVTQKQLPREFSSTAYIYEGFAVLIGTYFGSQVDFSKVGLDSITAHAIPTRTVLDVLDQANITASGAKPSSIFSTLFTSHTPAHFYAKSLKFTQDTLPSPPVLTEIVDYALGNATDPGTPLWFILFDLAGGKINDVPSNATSYFHRDALLWLQSYTVNLVGDGGVSARQKGFLNGLNKKIRELVPGVDDAAYPGYVDDGLEDFATSYWGGNVERLRGIKARYDFENVFRNGQSIRV